LQQQTDGVHDLLSYNAILTAASPLLVRIPPAPTSPRAIGVQDLVRFRNVGSRPSWHELLDFARQRGNSYRTPSQGGLTGVVP
jgi:hypothetical protein